MYELRKYFMSKILWRFLMLELSCKTPALRSFLLKMMRAKGFATFGRKRRLMAQQPLNSADIKWRKGKLSLPHGISMPQGIG